MTTGGWSRLSARILGSGDRRSLARAVGRPSPSSCGRVDSTPNCSIEHSPEHRIEQQSPAKETEIPSNYGAFSVKILSNHQQNIEHLAPSPFSPRSGGVHCSVFTKCSLNSLMNAPVSGGVWQTGGINGLNFRRSYSRFPRHSRSIRPGRRH